MSCLWNLHDLQTQKIAATAPLAEEIMLLQIPVDDERFFSFSSFFLPFFFFFLVWHIAASNSSSSSSYLNRIIKRMAVKERGLGLCLPEKERYIDR